MFVYPRGDRSTPRVQLSRIGNSACSLLPSGCIASQELFFYTVYQIPLSPLSDDIVDVVDTVGDAVETSVDVVESVTMEVVEVVEEVVETVSLGRR